MPVELPEETKTALVHSIRRYLAAELGTEIGNLQSEFLLEFILKEIGPSIYNVAIRDAQERLQLAVTDLDVNLNQAEFGHSTARRSSTKAKR